MENTNLIMEVIKENVDEKSLVDQISLESNIKELGIDSLKFMLVILSLEEKLGTRMDINKLSTVKNVSDLIGAVG